MNKNHTKTLMKITKSLPGYVFKQVLQVQVSFGIAYAVPALATLYFAYAHSLIAVPYIFVLALVFLAILVLLIEHLRSLVIAALYGQEEATHIRRLCALDEGFAEFWFKYNKGFSTEDFNTIERNLKNGASTKKNVNRDSADNT